MHGGVTNEVAERAELQRLKGAKVARFPISARGGRAIVVFVVLMGLFYGFVHTPVNEWSGFRVYLAMLAQIIGAGLKLIGYDVSVTGTTVFYPQFSMEIVRGCDAIEPTAIFAAAVLASPVPGWWMKAPLGILIGAAGLFVINLARLVSLFYVGIHYRNLFDMLHEQVWQMAFIVLAIAFWGVWVQWATKGENQSSKFDPGAPGQKPKSSDRIHTS